MLSAFVRLAEELAATAKRPCLRSTWQGGVLPPRKQKHCSNAVCISKVAEGWHSTEEIGVHALATGKRDI